MKVPNWLSYVVIGLLVIGIFYTLMNDPLLVILPVVIFGLIFYFVKRPPAFLNRFNKPNNNYYRTSSRVSRQTKQKKDRPRSKTTPFKVIEGGRDDNDTPRYH